MFKGRVWYKNKFALKLGKILSDLIAIIFFPENFIFSAVEALRLCKTFSRNPPHALSKPSTCSLKTLHMLSQNPPPLLRKLLPKPSSYTAYCTSYLLPTPPPAERQLLALYYSTQTVIGREIGCVKRFFRLFIHLLMNFIGNMYKEVYFTKKKKEAKCECK